MASKKLNKKEIGERISLAIAQSGRKAKDIAGALGVTEVTMSKYVHGVSTPKNAYLIELAKELNVSVSWLLGEDTTSEENTQKVDWERRAREAERKLEVLRGIIPKLNEINTIIARKDGLY